MTIWQPTAVYIKNKARCSLRFDFDRMTDAVVTLISRYYQSSFLDALRWEGGRKRGRERKIRAAIQFVSMQEVLVIFVLHSDYGLSVRLERRFLTFLHPRVALRHRRDQQRLIYITTKGARELHSILERTQ